MSLSDNISNRRRAAGLTQEDVASRLGVSRQTVGKWESGKATPELDKLVALCDLLDCSLDELVGRTGRQPNCPPHPAEAIEEGTAGDPVEGEPCTPKQPHNEQEEHGKPSCEAPLLWGPSQRAAATIAIGAWLLAASLGLTLLLVGPSSVDNVEVRRVVPIVIALGGAVGLVLIGLGRLRWAGTVHTEPLPSSVIKRRVPAAALAVAAIMLAAGILFAAASGTRWAVFIGVETTALAVLPISYSAVTMTGKCR